MHALARMRSRHRTTRSLHSLLFARMRQRSMSYMHRRMQYNIRTCVCACMLRTRSLRCVGMHDDSTWPYTTICMLFLSITLLDIYLIALSRLKACSTRFRPRMALASILATFISAFSRACSIGVKIFIQRIKPGFSG